MEAFELVEADFQQYYGIDLDQYYNEKIVGEKKGMLRYLRLFSELPPDSRCIKTLSPVESWTFADEMASLMLHQMRVLNAAFYNVNKAKTAKKVKVDDQFQPDYVKQAKDDYKAAKDAKKSEDIDDSTKEFWSNRIAPKVANPPPLKDEPSK